MTATAQTVKDVQNIMYGKQKEVLSPSGRRFVIREQNGEDDDILSNPLTNKDLSNLDHFLASVIIKEIKSDGKDKLITHNDTSMFLLQDRTALIFQSRIHSIGPMLDFTYDWGDDPVSGGKFSYSEDLSLYLHDYSKPFPEKGEEGYFEFKIPPYVENAYGKFDYTSTAGKELRFNLLNCESDRWLISIPIEQSTRNSELRARNLEQKLPDGEWQKVENFKFFSKPEIDALHKHINDLDKGYNPVTKLTHPKTGQIVHYPIFNCPSFFYPVGV